MIKPERLEYRGWTIELQRKHFRQKLQIILKPGKAVLVRVPAVVPLPTVFEFIDSRADWINKHLSRFRAQEATLPPTTMEIGGTYPYMGRRLKLQAVPTPLSRTFISEHEDSLIVHIPAPQFRDGVNDEAAHEAVRNFYRREGGKELVRRIEHWSLATGLRPTSVKVREARMRWGSCHPRGSISLNWRLMVFRPEVIDYVIVHELAHLKHPNHSRRFWDLVEMILPGSKALAKELHHDQRQSDFLQKRA